MAKHGRLPDNAGEKTKQKTPASFGLWLVEGVISLPFSFGGKKLKSWAEVQQNLKDKAHHEGMGVWKERGEP